MRGHIDLIFGDLDTYIHIFIYVSMNLMNIICVFR